MNPKSKKKQGKTQRDEKYNPQSTNSPSNKKGHKFSNSTLNDKRLFKEDIQNQFLKQQNSSREIQDSNQISSLYDFQINPIQKLEVNFDEFLNDNFLRDVRNINKNGVVLALNQSEQDFEMRNKNLLLSINNDQIDEQNDNLQSLAQELASKQPNMNDTLNQSSVFNQSSYGLVADITKRNKKQLFDSDEGKKVQTQKIKNKSKIIAVVEDENNEDFSQIDQQLGDNFRKSKNIDKFNAKKYQQQENQMGQELESSSRDRIQSNRPLFNASNRLNHSKTSKIKRQGHRNGIGILDDTQDIDLHQNQIDKEYMQSSTNKGTKFVDQAIKRDGTLSKIFGFFRRSSNRQI
eukprot:403359666